MATAEDRVRAGKTSQVCVGDTAKAEGTAALSGVVTGLTRITASDLFTRYF